MIVCMKQIEEILNEQQYPIPCTGPLVIFLYSEYSYIEYSYIEVLLYTQTNTGMACLYDWWMHTHLSVNQLMCMPRKV